ncbi:alkaline phosphatase [Desulfurispira natronophila]|uniref:Alkaline phosphatase n=1 Tax=Desulfurispira natronophila TaxID=682562 RepID=A0A7W7Y6H8_9BACT|nr:alkaline phosphatase [Desulfurispira natronophila]MBB5022897.1 alkaline phosphatase [Desulfurispira natronophila]
MRHQSGAKVRIFLMIIFTVALTAAMLAGCNGSNSKVNNEYPHNIILMIADGASFGAWEAANIYEYNNPTGAIFFQPDYHKYLMTTYPLNTSSSPTGDQQPQVGYDPEKAWGLESYNTPDVYLHQNATDSAASATAISTGIKTYNRAINWTNYPEGTGSPAPVTIAELAKETGKAVGTITSVMWSHATPAALSNARNISRRNLSVIANDMLDGQTLDLIMGAGHPQWNDDGQQVIPDDRLSEEITDSNAQFVGGRETWIALKEGTHSGQWMLMETHAELLAIAQGDMEIDDNSPPLLVTVQANRTLQQRRAGYHPQETPFSTVQTPDLPTLNTMTQAALNYLSVKGSDSGFFLHIEGGAVDWAAHANQTSRLVEEQLDFLDSVETVVEWIGHNGGWDNNLLIITTDHGNAMPMGSNSDTIAHASMTISDIMDGQYIEGENEKGVRWWSDHHTNELVPLFARGIGAEFLEDYITGTDSNFITYYPAWAESGFTGDYIDNTSVFELMKQRLSDSKIHSTQTPP